MKIMPSKILSTEVVHQNPWFDYKHDRFLLPNEQEADYYYSETVGSGCSMVVPLLDDGRLLLTSQHRYLRDRQSVEFPCGGIEKAESPSETAQRELLEETGWRADDFIKIGSFDGLNGLVKDTAHVFVARGLEQVRPPQADLCETIEIIFRRIDEFEDMIKRGEIWDGQTLATWAMTRDYLYKILGRA